MSYIRLFFKENLSLNLNSNLDKSQSHYISKVMRIKEGDNISLFNETGEWIVKIKEVKKGIINFVVIKKLRNVENDTEMWLAFTPIKFNYLNFMIQKATELGVTRFIPILTDRTVVREINKDRIKKIIIEASEQSNRIKLPKLEKLINFKDFLKIYKNTNIILGDLNKNEEKIHFNKNKPICILIGPEGGFSPSEVLLIKSFNHVKPVKLFNRILKSETAAILAVSIFKSYQNI